MSQNDNLKSQTIKGIIWKFCERLIAQLISFVISIILARLLMPEAYGVLALITVFITICDKLVISGFATSLIQKKDTDNIDYSSVLYFSIIISIFLYTLLFITAPTISDFYNNYDKELLVNVIRIMGIKIIITSVNSVQHAYVSKHMLFKKYFWSTLLGTITSGVIGTLMAYNGFGVWALVVQYLVNSFVDTIVLWITVKWKPQLVFSFERIRILYSFGWKIFTASIIKTLYYDLRSLIIGKYFSTVDLAYYNKGQSFPQLIESNVVGTIDSVLFPAFAKKQNSIIEVRSMLRRSIRLSSYLIMPLLTGLAAIAEPLVLLLLTEKWLPAVVYVRILSFSFLLSSVEVENTQAIKAIGRSDLVLKLEIVKKLIGIFLMIVAIKHGVLAIAVSMLFSSVISVLITSYPIKHLFDYSYRNQLGDVIVPLILSFIMFFIVWSVNGLNIMANWLIVIQIIVGFFIYVFLSRILKLESYNYLLKIIKQTVRRS